MKWVLWVEKISAVCLCYKQTYSLCVSSYRREKCFCPSIEGRPKFFNSQHVWLGLCAKQNLLLITVAHWYSNFKFVILARVDKCEVDDLFMSLKKSTDERAGLHTHTQMQEGNTSSMHFRLIMFSPRTLLLLPFHGINYYGMIK